MRNLFMFFGVCISYLLYIGEVQRLPWNLSTVPMAVAFILFGYEFKYFISKKKMSILRGCGYVVLIIVAPLMLPRGAL